MNNLQKIIVSFWGIAIIFSILSVYSFIEPIKLFDTAADDFINIFFVFKLFIFCIAVLTFFYKKRAVEKKGFHFLFNAKLGFLFFLIFLLVWLVLFNKFFVSGFPLSMFNKNIYDEMGVLFVVYNLTSIGSLFFIFYYVNFYKVNNWFGFLLLVFCILLSLKLSRIALLSNLFIFITLWLNFQKISSWVKFLFILFCLIFVTYFNNFIKIREEASNDRSVEIEISSSSIIDLYLGTPRYQAKMAEVNYSSTELLNSVLNPIPVLFREYSNSKYNSVDMYNYAIYSNFLVKDQVPMFYFDLFKVYGAVLTFLVWMFYILILFRISSVINFLSVYLSFKILFFSIYSLEGIVITIINDILPFYFLYLFFIRRRT